MPIPKLNANGVLPPHNGHLTHNGGPGTQGSSPYLATTLELCQTFGHTPERRTVLKGLLDFRASLYQLQIVEGFQWVSGAFLEDDRTKKKAPDHIQAVTFCKASSLLDDPEYKDISEPIKSGKKTRQQFHVEHMPVLLTMPPNVLIQQ